MCSDTRAPICHCIIPHPEQAALLVRKTDDGYEFPSTPLPQQCLDFFPDHIPHIRQTLHHMTMLEMTVLRHLENQGDTHICLMEIQSATAPLPDDYLWLDPRDENPRWANETSTHIWRLWSSISQVGGEPEMLAPWERAGWFSEAANWMQSRLGEAGYALTGPIEQFKGAWGWSSILTAATDRGTVYFKADYDKPPQELSVILKLAQRWPQNVPHFIAASEERGWMLMSDFGGVDLDTLDTPHFLRAAPLFAKIQQSTAPKIDDWRRLGCPDMTPAHILTITRRLIADTAVLCGGEHGLSPEEHQTLALRMPQIESLLLDLAASPLPNTISNEDFKPGNVRVTNGEYLFYDWSATVISHPLFGINYFLNRIARSDTDDGFLWRHDLTDERRRQILSAFLTEWTQYAPYDQLVSEFWLCRRLTLLYEAVKCYGDIPYLAAASPWGAGSLAYIPQALRRFLVALDYQPGG